MRELRGSADQAYAVVAALGAATHLSLDDWVDLLSRTQEAVNVLQAVQTVAMAHVSAIEDVELADGTVVEQHRGLGHERLDAPALVAGRLGLSEQAAAQRMECSVSMLTRTPALVHAMGSGMLDGFRASVLVDELSDAPATVAAEVVDRLAAHLPSETAGPLRRRARRVLSAVAPDVLARRCATIRERRGLHRSVDALGLDAWRGWYPAEQARTAWAAIDEVAQGSLRAGLADTIDQARADAHMDLLLGRITATIHLHPTIPATTIETTVPAATTETTVPAAEEVPSPSDELVELGGFGAPGTTFVSKAWLARTGTVVGAPVVCHPDTGAALAGDLRDGPTSRTVPGAPPVSPSYRPPPWMQALVRLRDGHCRFPGCSVAARFCDLDHVIPWPTGPTSAANLVCLCRRHHRIKQRRRWSVRAAPDAALTWRDPTGRVTTTAPVDHLHHIPTGRTVQFELTTDPDPHCPPVTTGPDTWSWLDDILLRQLLAAGLPEPDPPGRRRDRRTHPLVEMVACHPATTTITWRTRPPATRDDRPPY